MTNFLMLAEEVRDALARHAPIVALESTIISHGMPYPENVETAHTLENIVREQGAVPATIGIIAGRIVVGLSPLEIERLAKGGDVLKVSRRDLPYVLASGCDGATTVAGTMICAELAGIRVFATGGIGGVHREGERTMDVSADLSELGRTSVAVVSAGPKAILDIGRTLEVLETLGVPVISFGTDELPAFYTRESGFRASCRCDTAAEIARLLHAKWSLGVAGGVLVGVPVPEKDALPRDEVERAIAEALARAERAGISGKELTPFLLAAMKEITSGRSLATNIALVRNNAQVAAEIARWYAAERS